MNTYTLDPPKSEPAATFSPPPMMAPGYTPSNYQYPQGEPAAASTQAPMMSPVYMPPYYQYPKLEQATPSAPAPMMAPVYMPPTYQYPKPEHAAAVAAAPASMVAPTYVPPNYQHQPYQNPPAVNVQSDMSKIRDWLAWSIVNIFIGGLAGILPLIFSLVCRSKKRKNDINGARKMSTLALVFNIIATVAGVIGIVGLVVYLIVSTQLMRNIDVY